MKVQKTSLKKTTTIDFGNMNGLNFTRKIILRSTWVVLTLWTDHKTKLGKKTYPIHYSRIFMKLKGGVKILLEIFVKNFRLQKRKFLQITEIHGDKTIMTLDNDKSFDIELSCFLRIYIIVHGLRI